MDYADNGKTDGDTDVRQRVCLPGLAASSNMDSEVADKATFQGGLGLGMSRDKLSIMLNYDLNASENVTSHGISGAVRSNSNASGLRKALKISQFLVIAAVTSCQLTFC